MSLCGCWSGKGICDLVYSVVFMYCPNVRERLLPVKKTHNSACSPTS